MAGKSKSSGRLVYSTESGSNCPACNRPLKNCTCHGQSAAQKSDGIVRVSRQTKGRKGKGVTLVTGVPLGGEDLKDLARRLKQKCGSGGTVKDGIIEIQGEHRDQLVSELSAMGFIVRKSGG